MNRREMFHAWRSLRVCDLPNALRRLSGMAGPREDEFAFRLNPADEARLQEVSRHIRGSGPPAVFVHGVLPRSGTNFAANLLALHPDLDAFPRQLWELPTLAMADATLAWRHEWLARFPANEDAVPPFEPLAWVASGMMRALQRDAGERRMLFKSPHMRHVTMFDAIFPEDVLIMVVRDGRDVIASSRKTFGSQWYAKSFRQLAVEWRQATALALEIAGRCNPKRLLWRYEDLVATPGDILRRDLAKIGLEADRYPFEQLDDLPVFGSSSDQRPDQERWCPTRKSADFNPIGRWRGWSSNRLAAFEREAGEIMTLAGYR